VLHFLESIVGFQICGVTPFTSPYSYDLWKLLKGSS
jgi:hypothetical protein